MNTEKIFTESTNLNRNEDEIESEEQNKAKIFFEYEKDVKLNGTVLRDFDDLERNSQEDNLKSETIGIVQDLNTYPISSKVLRQKEWTISCDDVLSAFEFLRSFEIEEITENLDDITIIKFDVKENFETLNGREIDQMSSHFADSATVISFKVRDNGRFNIYWKSKDLEKFLALNECSGINSKENDFLCGFIEEFLTESLKTGHLGLFQSDNRGNVSISQLSDYRHYNLLQLAAETGKFAVVNILLKLNVPSGSEPTSAQTLAYTAGYFDILLYLLQKNLPFPEKFDLFKCPESIKEFYKSTEDLHKAITETDIEKVKEILSKNLNLRHFYNTSNESALKITVEMELPEIYAILVNHNISFGPNENDDEIYCNFSSENQRNIREIQLKVAQKSPESHIDILLANSIINYDESDVSEKFKIIKRAFLTLDGIPKIGIILRVVAASRKFKIIFDFNHDVASYVDPTAPYATGVLYLSGKIFIGAKGLLQSSLEFEVLAELAKELSLLAMNITFKNDCKPYTENNSETQKKFEEISNEVEKFSDKEDKISSVYLFYPQEMQHSQLISCVPLLNVLYHKCPEKISDLRENFHKLFDFFDNEVYKKLNDALPEIIYETEMEMERKDDKIVQLKQFLMLTVIVAVVFIISLIVLKKCN